jgi:sulfate permease, SulP family
MRWKNVSLISVLKKYDKATFQADLKAACMVSLLALPQSIGYALLAGLPPMVGLLSGIFTCIFSSLFTSSSYLVVGATSAIAILMHSSVVEVLNVFYRGVPLESREILAVGIMMQMTLLVGIFQILAGIFNLGRLMQFVSRSVMSGYMVGVACLILINQSFYFLGIPRLQGDFSAVEKIWFIGKSLPYLHWPTVLIALGSLFLLVIFRRHRSFISFSVLFLMTGVVCLIELSPQNLPLVNVNSEALTKVGLIRDMGLHGSEWGILGNPFFDWRIWEQITPLAFAIALLGMLETTTVSKSLSIRSGKDTSLNQDVLGLGIGNFLASFFGAMPSSASPSRSYASYSLGGKTSLVAAFTGLILGISVLLFSSLIELIPLATVAAILLMTSYTIVDVKQVRRCFNTTQSDAVVLTLTIVGMLLFSIDTAFYIGIGLSIILHLRSSMHPSIVEYSFDSKKGLVVPCEEFPQNPEIRVVCLEGEFYFAAADFFQDVLKRLSGSKKVKVIILHLQQAYHLDATACCVLRELHYSLKQKDIELILSGIQLPAWRVFKRFGLLKKIGKNRCFRWKASSSYRALEQAYQRGIEISQAANEQDRT